MWAIFRLWFNLQSSYTRCAGCCFRVLGVGWGKRDLIVSIVGTVTWGCYKWIIISCLCACVQVGTIQMLRICYKYIISNICVHILKTACVIRKKILCYWTNTTVWRTSKKSLIILPNGLINCPVSVVNCLVSDLSWRGLLLTVKFVCKLVLMRNWLTYYTELHGDTKGT